MLTPRRSFIEAARGSLEAGIVYPEFLCHHWSRSGESGWEGWHPLTVHVKQRNIPAVLGL